MLWLVVFNLIILLLAAGALQGMIPLKFLSGLISGLHATIGISTPTERQIRWVVFFWLVFIVFTVDGMLFLFAYVF